MILKANQKCVWSEEGHILVKLIYAPNITILDNDSEEDYDISDGILRSKNLVCTHIHPFCWSIFGLITVSQLASLTPFGGDSSSSGKSSWHPR